jgi:hypothetical protein
MTAEREYDDWIQADLDGELRGPARAALARYLLEHPEARADQEALAGVCQALADVPAEDPPADLTASIMAALPPQRRAAHPISGRGGPWGAFARRPMPMRFAAGLAGAALVAAIAYQLASTRDPLRSSDLVGTMAQPAREDGLGANAGPARDEALVQVGQFAAAVALHGEPTAPQVSVSVQSGAGLEVIVRAGGQAIHLAGSAADQAWPGVRVARFQPVAEPGTPTVQVEVVEPASGAVLQRTTLSFQGRR